MIKKFFTDALHLSNPIKIFVFNTKFDSQKIFAIKTSEKLKQFALKSLLKKSEANNFFPKTTSGLIHSEKNKAPEILYFKIDKAIVNIDSSAILKNNKLFTTYCENERFNEGFIVVHNKRHAKMNASIENTIPEGFFLGGNGSWNWYHFLVEIAPKILLIPQNSTKILLVSEKVKTIKSMQRVLEIIAADFKFIYLRQGKNYCIENLYYINDFNHIPFNNLRKGEIDSKGSVYNPEIMEAFSEKILKNISASDNNTYPKIFLERKTHRIANNQTELKLFLEKSGFMSIDPISLSFDEQVELFKNAKFIVGISGAGWTNLMFCRNKPKAICFLPDNAKEFSAFSNIAQNFEVDLYNIFYTSGEEHYANDFTLPLNEFKKLFYNLIND